MRSLLSILLLIFVSSSSYAQMLNPVTWTFDLEQQDGQNYIIIAEAKIQDPWVVYSHYTDEGGPIGTSLEIEEHVKGVTKIEELREEGMMIKEFSALFDIDVAKFKKKVTFKQKVKIDANTKRVDGYINFMTCDGLRCLPPNDVEFSLEVK